MKLNIYSIYDSVAQIYNKPFTDINNASAIRAFTDQAKKEPHKNDYVLYYLGDLDDQNGSIEPAPQPIKLLTGFDVKTDEEHLKNVPAHLQNQAE